MLRIYSGNCRQSDVGLATGIKDIDGNDLYTGDIVTLWHQTDWDDVAYSRGITVVTSDQWQSYSDGSHVEKTDALQFFVMGVKSVSIGEDKEWLVKRVKSFNDVINGEHWKDYGFNFREEPMTSNAWVFYISARAVWILLMPIHVTLYLLYFIGECATKLDRVVSWPHFRLWEMYERRGGDYDGWYDED